MLVLSRKPGEKVVINGNITITVIETHGGKVRIGIDAPTLVPIIRSELLKDREVEAFRHQWETSARKEESARVPEIVDQPTICAPATSSC